MTRNTGIVPRETTGHKEKSLSRQVHEISGLISFLANAFCSSLPSDFSLYVSQRGLLTVSELLFIGHGSLRFCGSRNIFYLPVLNNQGS